MAKLKAHEVDAFLAKSAPGYRIFLVYGPDRGLVSERAKLIAAGTKIPLDDPFSVIRLDASTINSDPARLADEALTVSMFGGDRLVWVKDAGNEKGLLEALKALTVNALDSVTIIIEADDLKPSSGLRSLCENAQTVMALPCYADDARAIDRLIDTELASAKLTISLDARTLLKNSLGGDRLASKSEIEKLVLYCLGQGRIE
jgi:DNA polymerase-3 subunit delta